jgi:hypothetical protein
VTEPQGAPKQSADTIQNAGWEMAHMKLRLGLINAFVTKIIFKHMLRRRAYSKEDFVRMLAATPFGSGEITKVPFGIEVRLAK